MSKEGILISRRRKDLRVGGIVVNGENFQFAVGHRRTQHRSAARDGRA